MASVAHSEFFLKFATGNKLNKSRNVLDQIFRHPDVVNRKIVTLSIIGTSKKGRKLFLTSSLRHMYANYPSINNLLNDPVHRSEFLDLDQDASDIFIWNDVFLHTDSSTGDKLAIVIIDARGLFDVETDLVHNLRMLATCTLMSSMQIFNVSEMIREDQLQYLQLAVEFARYVSRINLNDDETTFQYLLFLISDWNFSEKHKYGLTGGNEYMRRFLIKPQKEEELQSLRQYINGSFDELQCIPLPASYEAYKMEMQNFIEPFLSEKRFIIKKVNGVDLKGSEYVHYLLQHLTLLQSENMPQVQTIYESTIERQFESLNNECFERYKDLLPKNFDEVKNIENLPLRHELYKEKALLHFLKAKKSGNAEHQRKYHELLEIKIEELYKEWSSIVIQYHNGIQKKGPKEDTTHPAEEYEAKIHQMSKEREILMKKLENADHERKAFLKNNAALNQIINTLKDDMNNTHQQKDHAEGNAAMERRRLEKEVEKLKMQSHADGSKLREAETRCKRTEEELIVLRRQNNNSCCVLM